MRRVRLFFCLLCFSLSISLSAQRYHSAKTRKGLKVGSKVDNFSAKNQHDKNFNLEEALKKGPVVLVFYRGQWCPICNKHLGKLQDSLSMIEDLGATVVAISPEKPQYLQKTAKKTGAKFQLLYDNDYIIANQFKVSFRPSKSTRNIYNIALGARLKKAHSDRSERLPIPATFIIDKNSKVVWRHFDPNYKKRSSVADILVNLPKN